MAVNNSTENSSQRAQEVSSNLLSTQKDFNNLVSDGVANLTAVTAEYAKIKTSIDQMKLGELSLFDLSKKLLIAKGAQLKEQKKLNDLSKVVSSIEKNNAVETFKFINNKAAAEKKYLEIIEKGGKNAARDAAVQKAIIKTSESGIKATEKRLSKEGKLYLAQLQSNKVAQDGVNIIGKKMSSFKTTAMSGINGISSLVGAVTGKGKGFDSMFESGVDFLKAIPGVGGALGGLVGGMKALFDFVVEIEDRTVKFGRNLGYSREQSFEISNQFANIATGSGKLLLTTQNMMEVQTDLSQQLGVNNILTGEMLDTQIELKKVMGLTTDEMGELAKTSIISGQNQKQVVTGILGQVAGLKAATGISFNYKQIIGEVTKLGGVLGLQFAKYPEKLTKSLLVTKALGMDLKKVDQIAGGLLDFETAIQNQLEAQLITGKDINLSTAQQLALQGDTAGVAIELAAQMQKVGDFTKLTRIEQDAIAKAVGMERNEVADVLKNQQMLSKLSATDTKDAIVKLEALKAQGKTQEQLVALLGEGAYENLTQLSAQEKMAALIDKVKGALQDFLTKSGVVEFITGLIHKLSDPENVRGLVNMLKEGVAFVADAIQDMAYAALVVADLFADIDPAKYEAFEGPSAGDKIRSLGGDSGSMPVRDFVIKPMGEDTITMAGGTKLGRTDEMVDLLRQLLNETRQGKTINIDGAPVATAVARNAPMNYAASNLGPRPLR